MREGKKERKKQQLRYKNGEELFDEFWKKQKRNINS